MKRAKTKSGDSLALEEGFARVRLSDRDEPTFALLDRGILPIWLRFSEGAEFQLPQRGDIMLLPQGELL